MVLLIKIRHRQIEMSIESAKRRLYATDNGISHRDQYILKRTNRSNPAVEIVGQVVSGRHGVDRAALVVAVGVGVVVSVC